MPISEKTRKILWARSGNKCAICATILVRPKEVSNKHLIIGEECHIISKKASGPRHRYIADYDYDQSDNLLLLCCNHHKEVDDLLEKYTIDTLRTIKENHELSMQEQSTNKTTPRESIVTMLVNHHSKEDVKRRCEHTILTEKGLEIAFGEASKIKSLINEKVVEIKSTIPNIWIKLMDNRDHISNLVYDGHTLSVKFFQKYRNSASDSYLSIRIIKGIFNEYGEGDPIFRPKLLDGIELDFSFNETGIFGWTFTRNKKKFYTSEEIIEEWLVKFFTVVKKQDRNDRSYF